MNQLPLRLAVIALSTLCLASACTRYHPRPSIAVAEEIAMDGCVYLETIAVNSDMGRVQLHPKFTYDAQEQVVQRALKLGATHIVWLHNYPPGSAARAFHCPN